MILVCGSAEATMILNFYVDGANTEPPSIPEVFNLRDVEHRNTMQSPEIFIKAHS